MIRLGGGCASRLEAEKIGMDWYGSMTNYIKLNYRTLLQPTFANVQHDVFPVEDWAFMCESACGTDL